MFRFKRGVKVSYNLQGYIFFLSQRYKKASREERALIRQCCAQTDYPDAVFDFVTGSKGATWVCGKHFISESTLERAVKIYYIEMAARLK